MMYRERGCEYEVSVCFFRVYILVVCEIIVGLWKYGKNKFFIFKEL